jgi:glycerate kinase
MNILICPDSFKNSLDAIEVAKAIEVGIKRTNEEYIIEKIPLADGGEGSLDVLMNNAKGRYQKVTVKDPLFREIEASYGIIEETAVIEMARAAGLDLLKTDERNPILTSTYGVGELIKHALGQGIRKFIITIGGSATNDCGIGVAKALGVKFLDKSGKSIEPTGKGLASLHKIDNSTIDKRILSSEIKVMCDVNNPLYGENGAAYVYAKQKGANDEMIKVLDDNLRHFSQIVEKTYKKDISEVPGSGAAGGLGAGLMVFLKGTLVSGFSTISDILSLEGYIKSSDLIITGEGKIDSQSLNGKVVIEVSKIAKKYQKPVIAFVGSYEGDLSSFHALGLTSVFSILHSPINLEDALDKERTKGSLITLTEEVMGLYEAAR